jgi:hypothetical protein
MKFKTEEDQGSRIKDQGSRRAKQLSTTVVVVVVGADNFHNLH